MAWSKEAGKPKLQRFALWSLALLAWPSGVGAESYLVLSLIGDHLTVYTRVDQVGSHITARRPQIMPMKGTELDDFVVVTAGRVIRKAIPAAEVTMLRARDPELYKMRTGWLDADSIDVRELVKLVSKLFSPPPDSHLLLIAPYRAELQLKYDRGYAGSEVQAAGLGFYVDGYTRMTAADTLESVPGFLGVFANFQLLLVDLQRDNVLEVQQRVVVGETFAAARAADKTAWNALSGEKKVAELQFLLEREIDRAVPAMLSSLQHAAPAAAK